MVRDILERAVPRHTVWAFGSRAKWTAKPYSDLDIAIGSEHALTLETIATLNEAFQESALPFKVDVVALNTISPEFRAAIDADKVMLQSAG